ncbi:MAG: hypothetical protein Kow0069_07130 [Promethearchaeota archaeon]
MRHSKQLAAFVVFALLFGPTLTAGAAAATPSPALAVPEKALLPNRTMMDNFLENFPAIIDRMVSANISGENVYYATLDIVQQGEPQLHFRDDSGSFQYEVNDVLDFFSDMYDNLTALNASLGNMWGNLTAYDVGTPGWRFETAKKVWVKEALAIEALTNGTITFSTADMDWFLANVESWYEAAGTWDNATGEEVFLYFNRLVEPEGMIHALYLHELGLIDSHSVYDLNITMMVDHALQLIDGAKAELEAHAGGQLDVSASAFVNITDTVDVDEKAVVILWDHDDSLMSSVNRLRAGRRPTRQPFSGDEVFYGVHFITLNRTLSGKINATVDWKYDNGEEATAFRQVLREYMTDRHFVDWVARGAEIPVYLFEHLLRGSVYAEGTRTFREAHFAMGQLKVNALELRQVGDRILPTDVDLWYNEHQWIGLSVYNDTNGNGYQDVAIRGTAPFLYAETDEIAYRLRVQNVEQRVYTAPSVVGNQLVFGINFTGIDGELVPYDQPEDAYMLNDSTSPLDEHIDHAAFTFRFGVEELGNDTLTGDMKVDYQFADFKNASGAVDPQLDGYSLAMNTLFTAFRYRFLNKAFNGTMVLQSEKGQNLDPNAVNRIQRIRFASGDSLQFEARLDDIPYQWQGTNVSAVGQLIPIGLGSVTLGRASFVGDKLHVLGQSLSGGLFLYSISYPSWSGSAILHDPVFTTFVDTSTGGGGGLFGGNLKWLLVGAAALGIVAIVVVAVVKRRGSSYPWEAPSRGVEKPPTTRGPGPKAARWRLSSPLFFPPSARDRESKVGVDEVENFEFFSRLTTLVVRCRPRSPGAETEVSTWHLVHETTFDVESATPPPSLDEIFAALEAWGAKLQSDVATAGYCVLSREPVRGEGTGDGGGFSLLVAQFTVPRLTEVQVVLGALRPPAVGTLAEFREVVSDLPSAVAWHPDVERGDQTPWKEAGKITAELLRSRLPVVWAGTHVLVSRLDPEILADLRAVLAPGEPISASDLEEVTRDLASVAPDVARHLLRRFVDNFKRMSGD